MNEKKRDLGIIIFVVVFIIALYLASKAGWVGLDEYPTVESLGLH